MTTLNLRLGPFERMALAELNERKAEHDRTDVHVWLDVTIYSDTKRHFRCSYCQAEDWRACEPVDA